MSKSKDKKPVAPIFRDKDAHASEMMRMLRSVQKEILEMKKSRRTRKRVNKVKEEEEEEEIEPEPEPEPIDTSELIRDYFHRKIAEFGLASKFWFIKQKWYSMTTGPRETYLVIRPCVLSIKTIKNAGGFTPYEKDAEHTVAVTEIVHIIERNPNSARFANLANVGLADNEKNLFNANEIAERCQAKFIMLMSEEMVNEYLNKIVTMEYC